MVDTKSGKLTSSARLFSSTFLVITKVINPAAMEAMAAVEPQRRKAGSKPNNTGTAIGPINAPNQVTISPNTPPNFSYCNATTMVSSVNPNVVIRATPSEARADCILGEMSAEYHG